MLNLVINEERVLWPPGLVLRYITLDFHSHRHLFSLGRRIGKPQALSMDVLMKSYS
jgi:hypothetical protein